MEIGIGYLVQFHHAAFIQPASAPAGLASENTIEDDIHDMDALGPLFSRQRLGQRVNRPRSLIPSGIQR